MATVKSIDVALRAHTESWDSGLAKGTASLQKFSGDANRIAGEMAKVQNLLRVGAIGPQEYSQAIGRLTKDLDANIAGFGNMAGAVSRADAVMRGLETDTERYQNKLKELKQLFDLGALGPEQYAQAVDRTTAAFNATLGPSKNLTTELLANSVGFKSMSEAVSRSDSLLRGLETATERYTHQLRELSQLRKIGTLDQEQFTLAVKRTKEAFAATHPSAKQLADDTRAQKVGFDSMSSATSRAQSVLRGMETETEKYRSALKELAALRRLDIIGEGAYAQAVTRTKEAFKSSIVQVAADTKAKAAGFASMSDAMRRTDSILQKITTDTERYAASMRELNGLKQLGTITEVEYGRALASINPKAYGASTALKSVAGNKAGIGGLQGNVALLSNSLSAIGGAVPGVSGLATQLGNVAMVGGPIAAVAAAVSGLVLSLRNAMQDTDRVSDISMELGIDPNELLGLEHAARTTGVQISSLQAGLQRMTIHAAEAVSGSTEMKKVFEKLGIDAAKFVQVGPDQGFRAIAEGMMKIESPAERARLAMKLFGREGVTLLRVLSLGSEGLDKARERTIAFSNQLTADGVNATNAWKQATAELGLAWEGASQSLLTGAAPAVGFLAGAISKANTALMFSKEVLSGDAYGASIVAGWEQIGSSAQKAQVQIDQANKSLAYWDQDRPMIDLNPAKVHDGAAAVKEWTDGLKSDLAQIEQSLTKALTPQQQFLKNVERINAMYDMNLITLEKRNQLLEGSQKQLLLDPQEEERKKQATERANLVKQWQEQMKSAGASVANSVKSPFEKFTETVSQLHNLRQRGFITPEVFTRAFANAREEFSKTVLPDTFTAQVKGPAAIEAGTQASFSAFQENKRNVENRKDELTELKRHSQKLDTIIKRGIVLATAPGL